MLKFLVEYRSWLAFLLTFNVVLNCLLLLDEGLANASIIYINCIFFSILLIFMIVRFFKDRYIVKHVEDVTLSPMKAVISNHYKRQLEEAHQHYQTLKWQTAEANNQLLAWVHDMKSPLTAMRLMIDSMPVSNSKKKLEAEWLRMYLLVDQQLYITRLQTIEQDTRFEQVQIKKIIVEEIKGLQSWCMEKGIGIELIDMDATVKTDAKWLAFIIRQYLTNAIKYSENNSEIVIRESQTDEGHVVLVIEDNGIGIAPHDLPRVFKKSYTGTKGRESASASGMGLYLAKQAADSIGVKLTLENRSKGVSAKLQFPLENDYTNQLGM